MNMIRHTWAAHEVGPKNAKWVVQCGAEER
jgi:hypothetical protein